MTLAQNLGRFDSDIKSKLRIMSLEVDSAYQTECSTKAIRNGYGLLCFRLMRNASCEYDQWVVETQLCKLRDASDTLIGRACAIFHWHSLAVQNSRFGSKQPFWATTAARLVARSANTRFLARNNFRRRRKKLFHAFF